MGARGSKARSDRYMLRVAEFVRFASQGDLPSLQRMLKKRSVDVNAQDRFGMTALHWAAYAGRLNCVQELVKAGANAAVVDANGRNALHHACRKDRDEVARFLLETARVDINAFSESKETPLHKAVRGRCVKTVVVLLKYGADPQLRNDQNRTPLEELDISGYPITEEQVTTERVDNEFSAWQKTPPATESGLFVAITRRSSGPGSTSSTTQPTMVQKFKTRRSSISERSTGRSDGHGSITGMWATNADEMQTRTMSERPIQSIEPLKFASMAGSTSTPVAAFNSASSIAANDIPLLEPVQTTAMSETLRRKSLKYAGKRVIMALRVNKTMLCDEKRQMIRLLLEKYTLAAANAAAHPNGLTHRVSGLTLSLVADP